jgi:hypothetical protein
MAYMDAPADQPNGHTVVLHGNNFAGFYFGSTIAVLRKEGFRVVVPDQARRHEGSLRVKCPRVFAR